MSVPRHQQQQKKPIDWAFCFTHAMLRQPGQMVNLGLRQKDVGDPDYKQFCMQHSTYSQTLHATSKIDGGHPRVSIHPPMPHLPDSVFVEDTALCLPEGAVLLRPAHMSRAAEPQMNRAPLVEIYQGDLSRVTHLNSDDEGEDEDEEEEETMLEKEREEKEEKEDNEGDKADETQEETPPEDAPETQESKGSKKAEEKPKEKPVKEKATVEGGDIIVTDTEIIIGLSERTTRRGAEMLAHKLISEWGYSVRIVKVPNSVLHLKSECSLLANRSILATKRINDSGIFLRPQAPVFYKIIVAAEGEEAAANCIRFNNKVIMAKGYPRTVKKVRDAGYDVVEIDNSEPHKIDGGISCMSLRVSPIIR